MKLMLHKVTFEMEARFHRFYMCLNTTKQGFLKAIEGQLLVAIARDLNNQYFPLLVAIMELGTKETWLWFLIILLENIR